MWLFTKEANVSIVRSDSIKSKSQPWFAIRCRSRTQLVAFLKAYHSSEPLIETMIQDTQDSDYRYRVFVAQTTLQMIMLHVTKAIDYPNFKNACVGSKAYKNVLERVWCATADMFGYYGNKGSVDE